MDEAAPVAGATGAQRVRAMLEARSVAVVGASARPGSFGERMVRELLEGGFDGAAYPVNPNYDEVLGLPCAPAIGDLPEPVDVAILGVSNAMLEGQLSAAAAAGARSAVIFASGFEEPRAGAPALVERLSKIAREAGMAVCGGNCMGFVNVERGVRACGFYEPKGLAPGPIGFVSHSGSAFSAMLHTDRALRFNVVVSAGQEFVTTAADFVQYLLDLESTGVIGLFIETVRDPAAFRAALARAAERDVPVVALKVGREAASREMVAAHSGALAGEDGAYEALFDAHGVLRVESLDEMADTLALFAAGRRAGPGRLACIHDSGGERALMIDAAAEAGVAFAAISDATRARLAAALEPGLPAVNPLDAWGTGNAADDIYLECMRALLADDDTAALAFVVDLTTEDDPDAGYVSMARTVFAETHKPVAMLTNLASAVDRNDARRLDEAGIPILEGTATGLAAVRHLFDYRDARARPPASAGEPVAPEVRERWRARLREAAAGGVEALPELEALAMLADYGVPTVAAEAAGTEDAAAEAAARLGYPVALKTAARGVLHKSEAGGVRLGIGTEGDLRDAYRELAAALGSQTMIEAMVPAGVELALGMVRDEQFGPMLMLAAGGVLVEVLRDRRFALPPVDEPRAFAMLDRLRVRPMLDGARGAPAADVPAIARAVARLSVLAADVGDLLRAVDVNPLIAGPGGCVAVDALVIVGTDA
ncbi:MAG TPA: acetate--CoA ligase family protein [Actinomycetota bacterium]